MTYVYYTYMQKKLTITIDSAIYDELHRVIGRGRISQFIETLVRPHLARNDLKKAYKEMANDTAREKKATEWVDALAGDPGDESW